MASHLTIISGAGANAGIARALNGQVNVAAEASTDLSEGFAALLNLFGAHPTAPAAPAATPSLGAELLAGLTVDVDTDTTDDESPQTPEALAAAINAMLPLNPAPPKLEVEPAFDDLLSSLAEFKSKLENGEPLAPDFLEQLNGQLDAVGDALGIDLGALPDLTQLAYLAAAPVADDASPAVKLAASLAPLAEQLMEAAPEVPATAELAITVGEKLGTLLEALDAETIGPDKLAELGLSADAELDADVNAALAKLLAPAPKPDVPVAATAVRAKPALELSEAVLTGKAVDETAPASDTKVELAAGVEKTAADQPSDDTDTKDGDKGDGKPRDTNAETKSSAVATSVDTKPDVQAPGQIQHHAARVDAVAAPRVVQTGYQTSQQQLNLPQIAFELARQTSEGNTRFQIRLDPAELGRIDVQLDIDNSGQVNARLYVEKAETLDLMQRDQRGLEKALHQAGLDSAKTNLEFSLRQNNGGESGQQNRQQQGQIKFGGQVQGEVAELPPTINLYRASLSASGVNIIA